MEKRETAHVTNLLPAYLGGALDANTVEVIGTHLAVCQGCQGELLDWKAVAAASQALGSATPAPSRGLLDRVFENIDESERAPYWYERWIPVWLKRPVIARSLVSSFAMVFLALLVVLTPIGSYAQRLLEVFQPRQLVAVPITLSDMRALEALGQYGDLAYQSTGDPRRSDTIDEASSDSGFSVVAPGILPASVTAHPSYIIVPSQTATFTFDAEKTRETVRANGQELPPLPANIDGSSIELTSGVGVLTFYGGSPHVPGEEGARSTDVPQLIIGQAYAPQATSTGASPKELEDYILSLPGISDELANAIRAIGDPTTTWPIPVPVDEVNTRSATVQGAPATVFSELSGFATGVVWIKNGFIYGVAGPLNESDVLAVANSLR